MNAIDLTQRPPRSPRVRLGGYVLLPRMLDKGRAALTGKNGEYNYACPMDQHFLNFAGVDPEKLKLVLKEGKGDGEILEWIKINAEKRRSDAEVIAWSSEQAKRGPTPETGGIFKEILSQCGPHRKDIKTWFELLDLDDYVTFGGKA